MKQRIIILTILSVAAVGTLFALNLVSERPNKQKNGFERRIIGNAVTEIGSLSIDTDIKDICGISGDTVFFSHKTPNKISYTTDFKILNEIILDLPEVDYLAPVFYTTIIYPNIYILGGNSRKLIQGNIEDNEFEVYPFSAGHFGNGIVLNHQNFFVRAIDTINYHASFVKVNPFTNESTEDIGLSERLGDAGFTYSGKLSIDRITNKLFYSCFYNNQLLSFDTCLNLIAKGRTIDTVGSPKITIGKKGNSITHAAPPVVVNKLSFAVDNIIYVLSKLKADNEPEDAFFKNDVVDVYDGSLIEYRGSFYLPYDRKVGGLKRFAVFKDTIVAIYENSIKRYSMNKIDHS